jgi:hypothetical protein
MFLRIAHLDPGGVVKNISSVETETFASRSDKFSELTGKYKAYRTAMANSMKTKDEDLKTKVIEDIENDRLVFLHSWEDYVSMDWQYVPDELEDPFRFRCPFLEDLEDSRAFEDLRATTGRYWSLENYQFSYASFMNSMKPYGAAKMTVEEQNEYLEEVW